MMIEIHFTLVLRRRIFATCMVITDLDKESQQGNSCYKTIVSQFLWEKGWRCVAWQVSLKKKILFPSINETFW